MSTNYPQGTPCWIDIGTPDLDGAIAFYSDLFGWEVEKGPADMGHYSMARLHGRNVAGIADQQVPGVTVWTTYLAVDDVDTTVALVTEHGGTVIAEPMSVEGFGRMAIAADPGGAVVAFWEAGNHPGFDVTNEPGSVCWNELTTRAVEPSLEFYRAVLGLDGVHTPTDGMDYCEFRVDGRSVGGLMPMVGDMWPDEIPNHWMVYFAVDDADATAARCVELGGQAPVPPTDIPPGRFAVLTDPQGGHFSILRMSEELRAEVADS
jgi:predicted enzyme related to lactoylglutathione lyase